MTLEVIAAVESVGIVVVGDNAAPLTKPTVAVISVITMHIDTCRGCLGGIARQAHGVIPT